MPVRIYDIAKRLGIESKVVLTKAKELGITTARVPSSSLDKITAEYLEGQLAYLKPVPQPEPPPPSTAPAEAPPAEVPATQPEATVAPPAAEAPAPAGPTPSPESVAEPTPPPAVVVISTPPVEVIAPTPTEAPLVEIVAPSVVEPPPPKPAEPPPPPPPPKVGDLIGRIQLPLRGTRPSERGGKAASARTAGAPAPARAEPGRTAARQQSAGRSHTGGGRAQAQPPAAAPQRPAQPAGPKYVVAADAQLITMKPPIVVRDLADKLGRKPFQLIADLMELKVMANVNQAIDEKIAQQLSAKYGFRFEVEKRERGAGVHAPTKRQQDVDADDKPEDLQLRAPVVTIMGHVDHGKTSLLDVIRKSNVAAGEAGGITQHIGAYTISFPHPEKKGELRQITFLDTPGHAAFSAMRARGANVTDIVILVVAANDGVMPQTLEAISHAQAANVPMIVAVNKIDHPNSNPMKVRQQLQDKGVVPDDWGGNVPFVEVSALTKQGVDHLLEIILLQADLMELKANAKRRAKGNVIESGLTPAGPTATVLVRKGTLRLGDAVLCGQCYGKVRALINEEGQRLKEAAPSVAVKFLGLNAVPEAGDEFAVVEDDKTARQMATERIEARRAAPKEAAPATNIQDIFARLDSSVKTLKVVVKADTQGSVEAIVDALKKIESKQVTLDIVHSAVGTITENDVNIVAGSTQGKGGLIFGFHTRIDSGVADSAKRHGVTIKLYAIIYELIDEVKAAMAGLLDPILREVVIGSAEVRKIFELSKGGNVAGCIISNGRVARGRIRVRRRRDVVFEGLVASLRRFQDEVNEVRSGMECGIRIDGYNDFQEGDLIESYTVEKIAPEL